MADSRGRAPRRRLLRFPELCPACRRSSDAGFCDSCAAAFRTLRDPCTVCALPGRRDRCERHDSSWRIGRTWAVYEYAEPLAHYLQALKFSHGRALGRAFGLLVAAALRRERERGELDVDALVPVPLSPQRLRERGYNQAVEIARALAAELDLPLALGGVSRPVGGRAQSRLNARDRKANVAHAFRVGRGCDGRRLAIVDDVITTGATVNALAAALEA
ncbi:MAG: ComF family protein, partial [Gammaproteobacteria bacterium]|nr:ComF family protein [Gammaproteobacteria bacterium]